MTLQELSKYYKLRERLERDKGMLVSLEATAYPGAQDLEGMPHASGITDKVGDLAIEIADMKERIRFLSEKINQEESAVSDFINGIQNDQTRMIFRLRFLRCLTWSEVAHVIGGRNTGESVKSTCYRYLLNES